MLTRPSLWLVALLGIGCGPSSAGNDDGGGSTTAADAESSAAESDATSGADSTSGGAAECAEPEGAVLWTEQSGPGRPAGIALDPLSETGEFYVSYRLNGCLSRHDSNGAEQWLVEGFGCEHIAVDMLGDVLLAGGADDGGGTRARVSKRAPDGAELWSYDHVTTAASSTAQDVATDADANVLVGGKDLDVDLVDWVIALDATGALQWQVALDGVAVDDLRSRIGVDAAGNIVAAHTVVGPAGTNVVRAVKLDPAGTVQWSLELPGESSRLEALGVDEEGRALLGVNLLDGDATRSLVFVDADGTTLWTRSSEDTAIEYTTAIAFGPCDTVVVAGGGDPSSATFGGDRQLWISKLDLQGEPLWAHMIDGGFTGPDGEDDDLISAVVVDDEGRSTAVGLVTVDALGGGEKFPVLINERWIARFDP